MSFGSDFEHKGQRDKISSDRSKSNYFVPSNWFGHVESFSMTSNVFYLDFVLLKLGYSITRTAANRNKPLLYSFYDQNSLTSSVGIGINIKDWLGVEIGASFGWKDFSFLWTGEDSPLDFNGKVQITPWFSINASVGLGGISFGFSIIENNVTHDFSIQIPLLGIVFIILAWFGIPVPAFA